MTINEALNTGFDTEVVTTWSARYLKAGSVGFITQITKEGIMVDFGHGPYFFRKLKPKEKPKREEKTMASIKIK